MKFAKNVFTIAGAYGILILTPLYFLFDVIGKKDPPPITHPAFFYGFVGAGLAWQIAFLIISRDPLRYRTLMIPSVLEKFSYGIAVTVLVAQKRMNSSDMLFGGVDLFFGLLFIVAYLKTKSLHHEKH